MCHDGYNPNRKASIPKSEPKKSGISSWKGCKLDKCPYDKEHGYCETCDYLIREGDPDRSYNDK